jgi:hypothetical protein
MSFIPRGHGLALVEVLVKVAPITADIPPAAKSAVRVLNRTIPVP